MSNKLARKLAWRFEKMAWMWEFPSETTRQARTGTFWHCYPSHGIRAVLYVYCICCFLGQKSNIRYGAPFHNVRYTLYHSFCCFVSFTVLQETRQKTTVHLLQIWKGMCLLPSEHSSGGGYVINRRVREELQELGAQWIVRGLWKSPNKMVGLFNHPW